MTSEPIKGIYNTAEVFTKNYDKETEKQIKAICDLYPFKDSKIRIMPDCLVEDTEILTINGFKKIIDCTEDDLVANYDIKSELIFFDNIQKVIIRNKRKDERIYEYYNNQMNISFKVSENHRMGLYSNPGIKAKNISEIAMSDMIFSGKGFNSDSTCAVTDNQIRLICWIVCDAHIHTTHNAKSDCVNIRFNLNVERKIYRIKQLLDEEKIKYTTSIDGRGNTNINICEESSLEYIKLMEGKKELPKYFMTFNLWQSEVVFQEMIQGDGDYESYIKGRGYRFTSCNKNNIDVLSAISAINRGYSSVKEIKRKNPKHKTLYYINCIPYKKVMYSKSGTHNRILKRREIEYDDKLVCIQCASTFFIARQNGLTFITGNCHAGKGSVIGTSMTIKNKIVPNLVGVDISCGMLSINITDAYLDLRNLDAYINSSIPSGFNNNHVAQATLDEINDLKCYPLIKEADYNLALGSLGGGNHFIEVNKSSEGTTYLVIHSGSRNLGLQVAGFYQDLAINNVVKECETAKQKAKYDFEISGKDGRILNSELNIIRNQFNIPKELAYLSGEGFDSYVHDMKIMQKYANLNRMTMARRIVEECLYLDFDDCEKFETLHNYLDTDAMILRKGAISAKNGEKVIIPMNMRDGSLICQGKGNSEWNYSAPHGAGRIMSRTLALKNLQIADFKNSMKGIYTTSVTSKTLDESPMVYKPMQEIIDNIKDTVDIVSVIKPLYNFKAGSV